MNARCGTTTLGLDVGLAHLGWSRWLDGRLVQLGCIETKKAKDKDASASADLFRRAGELRLRLVDSGCGQESQVVMEAISWPRNASATGKMGVAYGVVACLFGHLPVEHIRPQDVRRALGLLKGKVDKNDMLGAIRDAPGCERLHELLEPLRKGLWQHPVDACAAVLASQAIARAA